MEPNKPVQLTAEWWMAYAPSGHAYYHNTTTNETTWTAPPGVSEPTSAKALDNQAMASYLASTQSAAQAPAAQPQGQSYTPQPAAGGAPSQATYMSDPKMPITVTGNGHIPAPWTSFNDVQLPQGLIQPMLQAGFQAPSAIQQHAWPIVASGRDLIGIAKTGSGKTLGFLMPAFAKMLQDRMSGSPCMLVMAPTRELAVQIDNDAKRFGGSANIVTALAYGGAPKGPQLGEMRKRPHLLTGTPGRLNDFLEARAISLNTVNFLCLDEADRMLDMGFEPQIRKVIGHVPTRRQTLMFTATWPKEVRRLASEFFRDPIEVRIGNADELQANTDIDQQVMVCRDSRDKEYRLLDVLRKGVQEGQVIVFTKTKKMCDQLARTISRMNVRCEAIHGDRDQMQRDRALDSFKSGESRILVATDVAARGLDVKSITMVVNFDPAGNAEDYVHRIGRTGRAGRKGTAVTLLTQDEGRSADQIMKVMEKTGKSVPPELARLAATAAPPRGGRGSRESFGSWGGGGGSRESFGHGASRDSFGGGGGGGGRDRSRSRGRGGGGRRRSSRSRTPPRRSRSRSGGRRNGGSNGSSYPPQPPAAQGGYPGYGMNGMQGMPGMMAGMPGMSGLQGMPGGMAL
mmetsp:Transcript_40738/g.87454  ORF Transcript_40738/g.87454 Transcript_40738/m.87454 type:complete len:627 (+) Transcript_40738:294-2174(+)